MSTHNICFYGELEIFFLFGFWVISRIFHLYRADRSSNMGENQNTGEKPLTIRKQNLAFPRVLNEAQTTEVRNLMD